MSWPLPFQRDNSAPVARERLQILLAHERTARSGPNLISILIEILAAISRHVAEKPDKVRVEVDRGGVVFTLAIELELPNVAKSRGFPEGLHSVAGE